MCDPCASVLSCARETLVPLTRDHVLPFARKHLFPIALDHLLPILKESINMIRGVPNDEIAQMKHELEIIEEAIHQADKMADAEGDDLADGTREKIKQLMEAFYHIQDVIDEYIIREEQQLPDPGCVDGASDYVKTKMLRLQIAHDIQIIKSQISEIKDTSSKKDHHEGSSSSITNSNDKALQDLRKTPFYMKESDVVGFEEPRKILIDWLVKGRDELTVVAVVAMGGRGKTTLAKKVFDSKEVKRFFEYHAWITVSQSYNIEELLRGLLKELYKQREIIPPQSIHEMNRDSLIDEVRNYLQGKRYVIVFDDVGNSDFWDYIQLAMIDEIKGCRILITTRNKDAAIACRKSAFIEIHKLKGLDHEQSLKLFNKKAFYDLKEVCPHNLTDISSKIVKKCCGLPLAIVVTAGLLCQSRNTAQWYKFNKNIKTKWKKYSVINKILALSYHDLSYNLKSCLLYFGIYPEDYKVDSKRLILQWIAEGFIKEEEGMTLEEVAEGYLNELINRNLVQVVSVNIDERPKYCRVHDLVHAMILEKFKDLSFAKNINVDGQSTLTGITRRLSMTINSDNLMESINSSQVRSLFYIGDNLSESFVRKIPIKYKILKVLVLNDEERFEISEDLGSLIHLKYLELNSVREENIYVTLKSIGMLENLETLDLTGFLYFYKMPKEICKLRKLRHFKGYYVSLIELKDDLGGLTSLQTLRGVKLDEGEDDGDNRVIDLIQELGKLKQLKELTLLGVKSRYMSALSFSINEMQLLEKLYITPISNDNFISMHLNSPPPMLRHLKLIGVLQKLPEWIPKLQNLTKLKLDSSFISDDILETLKSMPNLLTLSLRKNACVAESLQFHFQDGWFKSLKELVITNLICLDFILIDEGALPSLETLELYLPTEDKLPTGMQHLKKLKHLRIPSYMHPKGEDWFKNASGFITVTGPRPGKF